MRQLSGTRTQEMLCQIFHHGNLNKTIGYLYRGDLCSGKASDLYSEVLVSNFGLDTGYLGKRFP